MMWILGMIVIVSGVCLISWMIHEAMRNDIIPIDVELDRLPDAFDGCNILLITDIHRRTLPRDLLLSMKGTVNWVFLGGDIMEKNVPLSKVERNIQSVQSVAPVYAVHGNHDHDADVAGLDDLLHRYDVTLLQNDNTLLEHNGERVWLTGMDYPHVYKHAYPALPRLPEEELDRCRVVLVHDPAWVTRYTTLPADLILSGHTHGGQIIIPFIGAPQLSGFYQQHAHGLFKWKQPYGLVRNAQMLVSRGFGYRHVPLRFRCSAEMNLITLRKKSLQS
ncbi:putative MPP superfamily phosphohydrolase [Paenibacillus sp. DS2015]|uniref:metallophosphoesterase n=1 Tax=Paenibacillus sp. DS2015 TaxID=3373917 RepID=UPI003D1F5AAE